MAVPSTYRKLSVVSNDLLVSMKRLTLTTLDQLPPLARDLAKIAIYAAPLESGYSESLDSISDRFCDFYTSIEGQLQAWAQGGFVLSEPNANTVYGQPVSGTLNDSKLYKIRQQIYLLQHDGRHGSAYFLKYHHMRHFPQQFTPQDREHLDRIAKDFMDLLNSNISRQILSTGAPESFWSFIRSPLLPHLFLRNSYNKVARGTDCLGRSISHVLHDHSIDGSKPIWRDEDLHHVDILGRTAMFYACRRGNIEFVERLNDAGVDTCIQLATGMYPLHVAATLGFTSICKRICENDAQLRQGVENLLDGMGRTPVMCAANTDKHETVDFFLGRGLILKSPKQFNSILVDMASKGHSKTMKVLLRYMRRMLGRGSAFDIEVLKSAYWHAESRMHHDIMAALSSIMKFDHNKKDDIGHTSLSKAVVRGNTRHVKFLLSLCEDDLLLVNNSKTDTSKWAVDPNAKGNDNKSPLILATEIGMKECIRLLLTPRFLPVICREDLMSAQNIAQASGDQELCDIIDRAILDRLIERRPDAGPIWPDAHLERPQFRKRPEFLK
ncbi:uncharacterized protein N0V89_006007 [Didymosphaeria variabile]|uniref:Ankyrin n=1 Tax=Didymosphaeria variabile TaxID=1932322 RepID=A0A9W8XNZ6_9PLEO|nr:uncharacterized protein N0V89_006007 [Didymosphaeria variabile]KAJ4354273.1 hypothetical protein N0V89_006007 [Didymosphaeria variabile]